MTHLLEKVILFAVQISVIHALINVSDVFGRRYKRDLKDQECLTGCLQKAAKEFQGPVPSAARIDPGQQTQQQSDACTVYAVSSENGEKACKIMRAGLTCMKESCNADPEELAVLEFARDTDCAYAKELKVIKPTEKDCGSKNCKCSGCTAKCAQYMYVHNAAGNVNSGKELICKAAGCLYDCISSAMEKTCGAGAAAPIRAIVEEAKKCGYAAVDFSSVQCGGQRDVKKGTFPVVLITVILGLMIGA